MPVEFRPLHGSFGAEAIGADPALEADGPSFAAIEAASYRRSILLFSRVVDEPRAADRVHPAPRTAAHNGAARL
jgi:hypothetical protein